MAGIPGNPDPNLLVGYETSDDAGVYRLTDEIAIITTADFITPPVDDPFVFGQVAAANALSDVYAMGGRPVCCLNLAGFPAAKLETAVLGRIIAGALTKIHEAGAVLAGGHTTDDEEPKFGLAVTGVVHPRKYWTNARAVPGDALVLTKPLGGGVLLNANRRGWVAEKSLQECLQVMTTLNRTAAEVMQGFDVHAATDVTGFGLAGHAHEMAQASGTHLEIDLQAVPILTDALAMYERGVGTGMNRHNRRLVENHLHFSQPRPPRHAEIVFDPQTNGGLLVSVPAEQGPHLLDSLRQAGVEHAAGIGRVTPVENAIRLTFR